MKTAFRNKNFLLPFFLGVLVLTVIFSFKSSFETQVFYLNVSDTTAPIIFHAKDHKGKSVVSSNGIISFTTGLHNDFYQADSINKTGYFYVETKLAKLLNQSTVRVPLNISIVIDRSGSMEGIKMGYAKKAAKGIIDQLNSQDIVSVVMYDNYVDTVQSPINVVDKEKIKSKIDKIVPRASTNLWGGTEQGYEYVQMKYKPGYINRVLLISDGRANTGVTDSSVIHSKVQKYKDVNGISLSTFGVGLDYNETLMTDMAETGAGNYYFIDAPEKLIEIFDKELNGLVSVAAQDAEFRIKLPAGVRLQKSYPLQFQQTGNEIVVKLRDLSSEETKGTLLAFSIDNKINSDLKFTSSLVYTDVNDGMEKTLTNENILTPVKSMDAFLTHFNKPVIQETVLLTANEKLETAMNLMEKGDYRSAKQLIVENKNYLKANSFYVNGDHLLMQMDSLNSNYSNQFFAASAVNADSVKRFLKATKAVNYKIRNKKQ